MYKKVSLLVLGIISVSLIGLYVLGTRSIATPTDSTVATENSSLGTDRDGDGLLDWEEELHGTSPLIRDTDGDGTLDGEEILLGRDPTVAGPDDFFEVQEIKSQQMSEEQILIEKEKFFNDFLQNRADEIIELTIEGLVDNFDDQEFLTRYALEDINTFAIASTSEVRLYGNEIAAIFAKYGNENEYPDNEFEIFSKALETKDDSEMHKLKTLGLVYKNLSGELLEMSVPFGTAQNHLMFVNGYDVFSRAVTAMSDFFIDPVRGGGGYQSYIIQLAGIRAAFIYTADYFEKYGIIFNEDEVGRVFNSPWLP